MTNPRTPEYTAEQVAEVVEGLNAIIAEPAEYWHPTHISRDDIRTVLAEIKRLTLQVESAERERDQLRDNVYMLAHRLRRSADPSHLAHIIRICEEAGARLSLLRSDASDGICSRCRKPIEGFEPPGNGMSAGYYVAEAWQKFANPGETYICDACMWTDPRYIEAYGEVPVTPSTNAGWTTVDGVTVDPAMKVAVESEKRSLAGRVQPDSGGHRLA